MVDPRKTLVCLLLGAGLVACGDEEPRSAAQDAQAPRTLWDALGTVSYDFPVYGTVPGLVDASDLAVVGDVVDVRAGKTLGAPDTPDAVQTSHLVIDVERVLQARPGHRPRQVVLAMTTPMGQDAASLAELAAAQEQSIFLLTETGSPELYGPTSGDGIVIATATGAAFPLVEGETTALTEASRGSSLQEVAARVRAAGAR
ncbi:hypothetical protein [Kineosporia sp. NBRC 101731]|uniref:hypothetical protein n=1 Tax=Kineosporia sp. NBRC 101731 TaxID=3032199 RepID=UPI0024A45120|nr:hypothetical protein [Kineosporia sp. NBRC 101731]GLY29447.1 hypothetical protein Kisp02_28120 [Kineosporia sp. NBRC 101731]